MRHNYFEMLHFIPHRTLDKAQSMLVMIQFCRGHGYTVKFTSYVWLTFSDSKVRKNLRCRSNINSNVNNSSRTDDAWICNESNTITIQ